MVRTGEKREPSSPFREAITTIIQLFTARGGETYFMSGRKWKAADASFYRKKVGVPSFRRRSEREKKEIPKRGGSLLLYHRGFIRQPASSVKSRRGRKRTICREKKDSGGNRYSSGKSRIFSPSLLSEI